MTRQEYIEYLATETSKAEDIAKAIIGKAFLNDFQAAPINSVVMSMKAFLRDLSKEIDLYNGNIFPLREKPSAIEVYSIENSIVDMRYYFLASAPEVSEFWAICTGILRAALAIHLLDEGVEASCARYMGDDFYTFSYEICTADDIQGGAYDYMSFTCPETKTSFRFASFDGANDFYLKTMEA